MRSKSGVGLPPASVWRRCGQMVVLICVLARVEGQSSATPPFSCQIWQPATTRLRSESDDDGWTIGKKHLLFLRLRFSDTVENEPITADEAADLLAEANQRFVQMSYGQFSLESTITPLLQLEKDTAYYRDVGFAGVLMVARKAAAARGFRYEDFDLDLVHSPQIPGFPAGQANIRQRGALVHQNFAPLFVHELGHNLGLFHANLWDNARASIGFHSTPPFPSNISEYEENLAFDPASLMGNGDFRSPGNSAEYGDYFDPMGGSAGDFNAAFKLRLHWLTPMQIAPAHTNGIYRLYAFDQGTTATNRTYALRVPRLVDGRGQNFTFRYWVSFRSRAPEGISIPIGVQLHWIDQAESYTSQLLDLQPGTPLLAWDSALPLGRTYSDAEIGLHVTPRATGSNAGALWMDVQIAFDPPSTNRPPSLVLQASDTLLQPGQSIALIALAKDEDGDEPSFFWNLGDGSFQAGTNRVVKSWSKPGQYLVRCEAIDGRGGKTARQSLVRVGEPEPARFVIRGRVLTPNGKPVPGAFVTNGKIEVEAGMLPDYAMTETDSAGEFILSGLASGNYDVGAQAYGWLISRKNGDGPVRVDASNFSGLDFLATEIPAVTVSSGRTVKEGESLPVVFARTGDTGTDLLLEFAVNGTASHRNDYLGLTPRSVMIPKGRDSVSVTLRALEDLDEDADEEVVITLLPPGQTIRSISGPEGTREISYFYPGWEPRVTSVGELWFQTLPAFRRGAGSTTSINIVDTTPQGLQRISILNQFGIVYERPRTVVPVRITRIGSTAAPLVVQFSVRGTAQNGRDYDPIPSQVTIPSGADFMEVNIAPIPDGELEGDETVELILLSSAAYGIDGNSSVLLTIQEDEFHSSPNRLGFGFRFGAGLFLRLDGEAGKSYVLEASNDLIAWTGISTNVVDYSPIGIQIPPFTEAARYYRSWEVR